MCNVVSLGKLSVRQLIQILFCNIAHTRLAFEWSIGFKLNAIVFSIKYHENSSIFRVIDIHEIRREGIRSGFCEQ